MPSWKTSSICLLLVIDMVQMMDATGVLFPKHFPTMIDVNNLANTVDDGDVVFSRIKNGRQKFGRINHEFTSFICSVEYAVQL